MTRKIIFFLLFILSQNIFGQSPHFKTFSTENGLPDAVLYTPFQDSKGYIWLSTSQGVVRYDGQKFQKFTTNDGLLKNDVWGFFEDNHGHLFFEMFFNDALQLQYFDLKTERIKTITLSKEKILSKKYKEYASLNVANLGFEMLDSNTVCVYLERYAFANPASYFYAFLKVSEPELKVVEPPKNLLDIFKTNHELRVNGLMAVGQTIQNPVIQIFKAGIWQRFGTIPKIFKDPRWEMNHIRICSDSTFAFGYNKTIELFNRSGKLLKNHTLPSSFKGFNAHKIVPFLSFSTQQLGVDILDNSLTQFPFGSFLDEIGIKAVLIDKQKNWWITTLKNELLMVSEQALKYSQTWPFNEAVRHITKDPRGRTWIGTQSGKVFYKTENKNWQEMFFKPTFKDYIRGLICTPNGNLWIGNDIQLVKIDVNKAILPVTIVLKPQTFGINSDGNYVPFDLSHKVSFLVNSAVKSLSMSKNLLISESNHTWEVTEDKAKSTIRLLINGKSYSVVKYKNIIFLARPDGLYVKTDSLRRVKSIPAVSIGDVAMDSKGLLYVSPEEGGLYVYDIIRKKVVRNKLVGNGMVNKVVIDGDVAWVCSQSRGLIKLEQNKIITFGLADGLPSVNVLDVLVEKNRLVIATGKGVTTAPKPPLPPEGGAMIPPSGGQGGLHSLIFQHNSKDSVLLFPDLTKKLILNNDQNNLKFIFNNLDYHIPENAVYQYVLFKNNDTLSVIEKPELIHELRFLEAGNYRLEVSGLSKQFKKLSYSFEILKPFWQRWWFWAIILGIISALVYYQIRLSMKKASMELRALQGQMNAHFAANFMETVKNLVLREDKLKAFNVLSMFGGLMRNFVVASRSKQTTVEEEVEFLKRYIQLAKLVYNLQKTEEYDKTLTDMVVVEDGVDLKTRIRSLLIQPIVENAFKYGIFHKEAESQLLVRFEPNNSKTIKCIIEDDGVGRKRVAEIQAQENKDLQLLGAKTIDTKGSIETMREAGVKIKVIDLPQGLRIEMLLEILN